jgi:hypothetical protein
MRLGTRVVDVADILVRHRRLPDRGFWAEGDGAREVRAAANDFRRARLGLGPDGRADHGSGTREGAQLTIVTQTDTCEQAIAAVQAAYGLNPTAVAGSWRYAPGVVPRPGPESLSGEDLGQGWTERMLFDTVAAVVPGGARAVLSRLVEVGGTVSYDDVQDHFAQTWPSLRLKRLTVASPSSIAATMSPFSGTGWRRTVTQSPSQIAASIIESPTT